jgi:hypothetical protein
MGFLIKESNGTDKYGEKAIEDSDMFFKRLKIT